MSRIYLKHLLALAEAEEARLAEKAAAAPNDKVIAAHLNVARTRVYHHRKRLRLPTLPPG